MISGDPQQTEQLRQRLHAAIADDDHPFAIMAALAMELGLFVTACQKAGIRPGRHPDEFLQASIDAIESIIRLTVQTCGETLDAEQVLSALGRIVERGEA